MSIDIRSASGNDSNALARLFDKYRQFYQQTPDIDGALQFIDSRLSRQESFVLLASTDTDDVGFLQVYPTFSSISMADVWLINDLFVDESARGQGVANQLITRCIEQAKAHRVKLIRISTEFSNTAASGLYEKIGFEKDTRFQHYNFFLNG